MREKAPRGEKPLHWVASSKRDLMAMPGQVARHIDSALSVAQYGGIRMSRADVELVARRLKAAAADYEERYGAKDKNS